MELTYLITYLTIAILVWYLISEVFKAKSGKHRIAAGIFVGIIFLFIMWSVWSTYKDEKREMNDYRNDYHNDKGAADNEDSEVSESEEEIEEKDRVYIQNKYKLKPIGLSVMDGKTKEVGGLKYKNFKMWYLGPVFLQKFTNAISIALDLQENRVAEFSKKAMKKIKKLKSNQNKKDGIAGIMQSLTERNEELKLHELALERCDKLRKIIDFRRKTNSIERTRRNLINALTNSKRGLDSIIGRENIKDFIALQLNTFAENPRIFLTKYQNTIIKGPSGIGKTKLAQVIGYVYGTSGIILVKDVGEYTKTAITTAYVDESAKMTRKLFLSYLGAVIFFDEAYDIASPKTAYGGNTGHGSDAITEMINFMNDTVGLTIVIAAGYQKDMEERFEGSNQGIDRRFPHKHVLDFYNSKELTMILLSFMKNTCPELDFDDEVGNYMYSLVNYINTRDNKYSLKDRVFGTQAGSMESLSGSVSSAIYGIQGKSWPEDHEFLIRSGFNSFLSQYNINIQQGSI